MKRLFLFLFTLPLLWIVQGCRVTESTTKFQYTQARKLDVSPNAYVKPLVAELKVDTEKGRIKDEWSLSKEDVEEALGGDINNIYAYGLFKSSQKHGADEIVAPIFDLKTDEENPDYYKLTIIGYPASFVNWGPVKESDYEWIKLDKCIFSSEINKSPVFVK